MTKFSPAIKISLIYFAVGTLWILLSDTLMSTLFPNLNVIYEIGLIKGLLFVLITTLIIYYSSKNYLDKIKRESSERISTELELKKEKKLLQKVAEISPIAITILNPEGLISFANNAAQKLLMLSESKLQNKRYDSPEWKIADFNGSEFPKEQLPFYQVINSGKSVFNVRHTVELPNKQKLYLSINASPIFDEKKQSLDGVIAVISNITESIQYERRLIDFRLTYRGIFDSVKEAICVHDTNRVIVDVNRRAEEIFGYSRKEFIGKTHLLLVAPKKNNMGVIEEAIDKVFSGTSQKITFIARKSDGVEFPVEVNLVKGKYFENDVMIAVVRDISDRFRMEEELKASERKYRILFEYNPQPMWVYDLTTLQFMDVNGAAIAKYGYSKDEFLKMNLKDIRPEEESRRIELYVKNIREKNITHIDSNIWPHKTKDGSIIHVRIISHKIELDGRACRIVLANDVTEVIQKENELVESEKRYRRIFENIVDVYYETTIDGKILEISPSIHILTYGKFSREDLLGRNMAELYVDEAERKTYVSQLLKRGRVYDYEIRLRNKDQRIIHCSVTSKLISLGKEQKIVGSLRDITVRKNYEEDLIRAKEEAERINQLKSEFLAQMSHEIRTPLNIILNSSQLVKDELSSEQVKSFSELFSLQKSAGSRIIRTIDSILNMSELQAGIYEPDFRNINILNKLLPELLHEYKILAKEKSIELKLESKTSEAIIWGDNYSVTQILSNLVDNAIKYTMEGKVIISVEAEENCIAVKVKDTGIGIGNEFIPHLFEAFRQEQQGYSRMFEGNGLGLAIVKRYCDINEAQISVESERHKGSTFKVCFKKGH